MKVLSLFSGVGGFDLGLENAGMETVFQCEWDKHATKILERHWPDVPRWTDVSTLTGAYVLQHAPVIDVVAWGSPCQDLSVAGKRAGLSGKRSGLFHEGIRIIKEIRELTNGKYPRISVWENVAGALSSGAGADFGQVLYEMDEAGACFSEWRLLDAQYFGVPQRRRRVFVVSVFDLATAERCPNPLLPVSEGVRWNPSQGRTTRETVARTVEQSPASSGHRMLGERGDGTDNLVTAIVIREREGKTGGGKGPLYGEEKSHSLIASNDQKLFVAPIGFSHTQGLSAQPSESAWPTLRTEGAGMAVAIPIQDGREIEKHQNGLGIASEGEPSYTLDQTGAQAVAYSIREDAKANTFSATELDRANALNSLRPSPQSHHAQMFITESYDEYNDRLGGQVHHALRAGTKQSTGVVVDAAGFKPGASANAHSIGYEEGLSPSLEAGGGGNNRPAVLEPTMSVRRLTPLECERLMGWPDDWTAGQSDTHRYKQCGNGVASPVAQWIGEQIINL